MQRNKPIIHSTIRINKHIELVSDDIVTGYRYLLPLYQVQSQPEIAGIFYVHVFINYTNHHFTLMFDLVNAKVTISLENEEDVDLSFLLVKEYLINIKSATKEYLKQHLRLDKLISELI